ncbi:hypothetical protein [Ruegeria sp. 6PALISEP08]|uniref:hypothetical protein n=1 Tax=Ruegeria sp. 6PALISEP08 TaxID=1225660 RepID=UPI00067ED8DC|nr:hypothetical protein [Ruegeria sp. 6PALISEP08]
MKEFYRSDLKAHVRTDDGNHVRKIRHSQQYWESPVGGGGLATATRYLRDLASVYEIATPRLDNLETKVTYLDPKKAPEDYRLSDEKGRFDGRVYGFFQTYLNVPVWRAGLRVTIKQGPNRVIASEDTTVPGVDAKLPSRKTIDRWRSVFVNANTVTTQTHALRANADLRTTTFGPAAGEAGGDGEQPGSDLIRKALTFQESGEDQRVTSRLIQGRFWIYRFDPDLRLDPHHRHDPNPVIQEDDAPARRRSKRSGGEVFDHGMPQPFDLPAVPDRIKDGSDYMVAEVNFELTVGADKRVWRMLVELESNAVLYLRSLSGCVDGLVFEDDPITKTGNTALNSASNNATLNPQRDDVTLQNLDPPSGGTQSLIGTYAEVTQVAGLDPGEPTETTGTDFDYDARTHDFASVSGYFHVDRIFRTMEDLGFTVIGDYMANTSFPIPVDIRYWSNNTINALCNGNGSGGIGSVGYGLMDTTDTTNPLGRAADPRVHLHEVLGHGILYEGVDFANFGFCHSAGDVLSMIYFDPDSNCWGVDGTAVNKPGDLRFTYVPWHPSLNRRADRDIADGWAWNGSRDTGGYPSEEILSTTLFRFYRAIGGDHPNLGRRQFASRMSMYLIMRAIGDLTSGTNPAYARDFCDQLMSTDALNWTSEGVFGGAYHKVLRWCFEQQGEYQTPLVVDGIAPDGTITTAGDPPDTDVYIDDGRAGGYDFQHVHWNTTTIWNRRMADGIEAHQEPALNEVNYAYVKIKNRGTAQAQNVVVYGYHTKPGAGLNWPADFEAFSTPSVNAGTLDANDSEEKIIGPFDWTPNINAYGHDCMLIVVTADGDASNIDNFTAGETIPEWRLVPNDNNVGQRNVNPVPGGGGEQGLMAGLDNVSFWAGNPNPERGQMTFDIHLPRLLRDRGWRLELVGVGAGFSLASGAKREVFIKLHPGQSFTRDSVETASDRDIRIDVLANDGLVGGMTYRLDPDIKRPYNADKPKDKDCLDEAQRLAKCLGIDQDISKVCVKEIVLGLKVKSDDCC